MAEDLGRRLLMEIEQVRFDEISQVLHLGRKGEKSYFGLPQLDRVLTIVEQTKRNANTTMIAQPIIELTSTAPGGGKTHLLYYLTAIAALPSNLGGLDSCAVIFDTDNAFCVPRLAQQIELLARNKIPDISSENLDALLLEALKHVHIFYPQSLASLTDTLTALPDYLLDKSRHYSFSRRVAFLALDSASAFHWPARAAEETAALLAKTNATTTSSELSEPGYTQLTAALRTATSTLQTPALLTSWHLGPQPPPTNSHNTSESPSFRPSLQAPLSQLPTLRFLVRRLAVRTFPAGISIEEALREAPDRRKAVEDGRFECGINAWGIEERLLAKLKKDDGGFGFRVLREGLVMD
ncbi:hypothetical protein LTR78_001537 [Recurvomyces mirabilis]|uniref:DNA recombination and repair protein Rad51-like C-terminal domain-containing protein n=1 Tax=Recurvomyces mirabilis TaxID=574656 RepID=A0AAE0WWE5_9PEZI|nr:hypothetical protein LTR78_001537 [Recurvomyces mirabilis]KAK5161515.1 hypothetical protein LTS14_001311 [Recurvomyces mirabilis]